MTDERPTEAARRLAARRPTATYTCEVCGTPFEALARTRQAPRTDTPACRSALSRRERRAAAEARADELAGD